MATETETAALTRMKLSPESSVSTNVPRVLSRILTVLLPDGIGTDFIREVHRARPELPVLVVTLVREQEVHDWARAMGATEVMTKDVAPEGIVAAVRRLAN